MKACVIIPARNEARTIRAVVAGARRHVREVIVVDDASHDATASEAGAAGAEVLRLSPGGGKGCALRLAFKHVLPRDYDFLVLMDGDGQHHPDDLPGMLTAITSLPADIVIGNRMANPAPMPLLRRIPNRGISFLISRLIGCRLHDTQSGFKVFRKAILPALDLRASRYETETEFILQAARGGYRIAEHPIRTIYGEVRSMLKMLPSSPGILRLIWGALGQGHPPRGKNVPEKNVR